MSIELKKCTKKFNEKVILNEVTTTIPNGLFRLIGKNGVGKSTFLRMISGLDKKYLGELTLGNGQTLYLNVEPVGIHPFTLKENLEILWKTFDLNPSEEQLAKVTEFFDGNLNVSYSKSSTGMKAKIGLSLIFVKDWDTILIDETMSTLDSDSISMIADTLINSAKKNKSTIIYVSHSLINEKLDKHSNNIMLKGGNILWGNTLD
ncbi:ATP-binding cassette domain-containing protein [Bacillus sp. WLY-B-L8]|uniref:ATP-binding cassette domain-containing protein n=1 Tax=Bacillus multifaciens TaxID=3068506 RepID=UPI002741C3E7|nr:ATP-binding cassette domain-containing protein [Bacillus sp. WLY-B-L8]MDP7981443.1 ATP-binding cassette domain-containing protein [Bacillus sp. WLY-B-L8]